jgi:FMN phosphatase YigB (HAD superfamily)
LQSRTLRDFGVEITAGELVSPVLTADKYFFREIARLPMGRRNPEEQAEVYMRYHNVVLTEAGVKADQKLVFKLMKKVQQLSEGATFALFDDMLPTMKTLKEQKFILGLLTNASKDMISIHRKLGLEPYLSFMVTS